MEPNQYNKKISQYVFNNKTFIDLNSEDQNELIKLYIANKNLILIMDEIKDQLICFYNYDKSKENIESMINTLGVELVLVVHQKIISNIKMDIDDAYSSKEWENRKLGIGIIDVEEEPYSRFLRSGEDECTQFGEYLDWLPSCRIDN